MKNNSILITGITGFVGSNLSKYLDKDFEIIGISRNKNKKIISYKQISKEIFDNSKAMIHLAGKAHDLKKTTEDKEYFAVNTELTKNLFNQFLASSCEIFHLCKFNKSSGRQSRRKIK